jgi:ferredoxin-thioredoxin reductase catalytic subunit
MNQWTTHLKEYSDALIRVSSIAEQNGYVLNPDEERVRKVVGLMTENFVNAGKYYCPCKQTQPLNPAKDEVCPCPQLKEEVAKDGHCFCRLFFKKPD